MNDVPKASEYLKNLKHRWPFIRQETAQLAGLHPKNAQDETEILAWFLFIEIARLDAAERGFIEADVSALKGVVMSMCGALGRCARNGADVSVCVPDIKRLKESDCVGLKTSAVWVLKCSERPERKAA